MNNEKVLEILKNEYNTAMKHAEEIRAEYMKLAYEQAMIAAFNELDEKSQMILTLGLLTGEIKVDDIFNFDEMLAAKAAAEKDMAEERHSNSNKDEMIVIHLIVEE
jgi:hypothetical protein